jgi:hypothetical protein
MFMERWMRRMARNFEFWILNFEFWMLMERERERRKWAVISEQWAEKKNRKRKRKRSERNVCSVGLWPSCEWDVVYRWGRGRGREILNFEFWILNCAAAQLIGIDGHRPPLQGISFNI